MRHFFAGFIATAIVTSSADAQIRTPIATEPLTTSTAPGPAPYNAKAVATSPTSATVSWDGISNVRAYTVDRTRTDDPACCAAHSGPMTTPSWNDAGLEGGREYSFVITALYSDGRVGSTEVIVATPMPALPSVRLPRGGELSSAEGVLRLTPCGQKNSGGPGPGSIIAQAGTPAGARFFWRPVSGSDMNYVVDRAPEGTTTWSLVGSTCGGPSLLYVGTDAVYFRDLAGGVSPNGRYVYRVTAIASNGAAGWNSYHFTPPCRNLTAPQVQVSGSTVTLQWGTGSSCGAEQSTAPDSYTLSSSFGYVKTRSGGSGTSFMDAVYGVPIGTHTFTLVGNYRTGGSTNTVTVNATVAY